MTETTPATAAIWVFLEKGRQILLPTYRVAARKGFFALAILIGFVLLPGCASISVQSKYQPPPTNEVRNAGFVRLPLNAAWDGFVQRLSRGFFVVNNISKESRLINISVDVSRGANYFDCGAMNYVVNGKPWNIRVARSSRFLEAGWRKKTYINHMVTGALGPRMNIFVAPKGDGTLFEVNLTYSIQIKQSGGQELQNLYGNVVSADYLDDLEASFDFTTTRSAQARFGDTDVTCRSTGVWEREVLELARPD